MPLLKIIDYRLLYKVSKFYYEKGLTQLEISKRLSISRTKVSRLLTQAEEVGIVKHQINPINGLNTDLEDQLETKFGLIEAIVIEVSEPNSQTAVLREVGAAAAFYFARVISDHSVIGISWGKTLREMVDNLYIQDCRNSEVVQLIGGLGKPEAEEHASYILRKVVDHLGCKLSILNMPGIVDTSEVKKAILSDSHVKEVFSLFPKIDVAFVGIGAPTSDSVVMRDGSILHQDELNILLKKGVVGDICLRFFDEEGNSVPSDIDQRVVGITLEELKNIPHVVGIAGGPHKIQTIRGALNGKLINVIVTDRVSASKLLKE